MIPKDGNNSITLSGDTGYCNNIIKLVENSDLLVLECSLPDKNPTKGHLTPLMAAEIAVKSGCRKLILTHFYPQCEQVNIKKIINKNFPYECIIGEDMMRVAL